MYVCVCSPSVVCRPLRSPTAVQGYAETYQPPPGIIPHIVGLEAPGVGDRPVEKPTTSSACREFFFFFNRRQLYSISSLKGSPDSQVQTP
jgi:hypothetical protein